MITVLLVLHLLVTLTLIATVLVQRSEGGGLGIGSSQGMGSFMSGRGTANLLTRTTSILAAIFMALSLALAVMNRGTAGHSRDILNLPETAPAAAPGATAPALPAAPIPGTAPAAPSPAAAPKAPASVAPVTPAPTGPAPAIPVPGQDAPKH
ncbi:preprotein translocase subunit SecG [Acetobacteraceae bacterium KSS8]|uniref:Protein-export membrane protein SecG n=1 Tax=Endosaccharibacter trunci TaxID=2812733 RepID=A0ABT1W3J7_9PROT|nr:preprotein translocase subunit SecG [Acetobacteraceae bacterium KSS8]